MIAETEIAQQEKKKRGQRGGKEVGCRARLKGWLFHVAERSPIWGDVNIERFCAVTGYSREHVMRELTRLRKGCEDLVFETKIREKKGKSRKVWGVIVALKVKLDYDERSLFYGKDGKRLHNRTKLGRGGEKLEPTFDRAQKNCSQLASSLKNKNQVCDNPKKRKDSFRIQQLKNSAGRKLDPKARLRAKAFAMLHNLKWEHWDNCKVHFNRKMAFCYLYKALEDGHEAKRILWCYSKALVVCHAHAVDKGASIGQVTFFSLSSTVSKARKRLLEDGLTREERIKLWYHTTRGKLR